MAEDSDSGVLSFPTLIRSRIPMCLHLKTMDAFKVRNLMFLGEAGWGSGKRNIRNSSFHKTWKQTK